jgi:hypothetical protein
LRCGALEIAVGGDTATGTETKALGSEQIAFLGSSFGRIPRS